MNDFVKEIASVMKESKTKPYDTVAKVLRVDERTAYVHIDGGADETPAQMAINCKAGDSVKIRVSGGKAWLTGNLTSPPTDDTAANEANKTVTKVKKSYENFKSETADNFDSQNKNIDDFKSETADNFDSQNKNFNNFKDATEENFNSQEEKIKDAYDKSLEAAKVATNFMKYVDGLGLIVGDMRGNTLGQNTLLDANGMVVRNNDEEIVRFGITDIKMVNEDGDPVYSGTGSVVKSQNNIVVSTQQTNDEDDTYAGGKAALELYYDSAKDIVGFSLSVKKGTSYTDLYETIGNGIYADNSNTKIIASDMIKLDAERIFLATSLATWRPYFCTGDSISATFGTAGYITNSSKDVTFIIPLSRPIVGNPTVTVASVEGLIIRQNNKYLYGGSSTNYVKPNKYTVRSTLSASCIHVVATMPNTTDVTNNSPCGIWANIKITFS